MRDLVSLAEKREAACKEEISTLLASRSNMYEVRPSARTASPAPAAAAAEGGVAAAATNEEGGVQACDEDDEECEESMEAAAAKIQEAAKRMEAAQVGVRRRLLQLTADERQQ